VVSHVANHPHEPTNLDSLASVGCMERTSFSRLFRSKIGITLREFLHVYRVANAKVLMEATDISLTEIAYAVGFSSFATFERTFKKVSGSAPSVYRTNALARARQVS